jgi:hypothetical protein
VKVPINPQTRVPTGQLGYEQGVDHTQGARALASVVAKYGEYADQENRKRELFDVQKTLVDETNNIQKDFEDKQNAEKLGAPNFVPRVDGEYNTRHQAIIQDFRDRGYSDDAVNELTTRLGGIRSSMVAKAIDFQEKSRFAKGVSDAKDMALGLSQYANTNPMAVQSALDEFRTSLKNSGLDALEQEQIYDNQKEIILTGARQGFAVKHPEVVLGLYGLPNEITTTSPAVLPAGQEFSLPSYMKHLLPAEGTGKNPRSSARGFGQFLDSTWLETYKQVYGKGNETDQQILAKKTDRTIATKLTEKFTQNNIQKLSAAGKPVNEATVYLAHFLGINDALDVMSAHADATIGKLVNGKSIAANPSVFKKVKTAGDMLSWAQGKMGQPAQVAALAPIPKGWKGNVEDAIQELGMTADQAITYLDTGKDTRVAGQQSTASQGPVTPQTAMDKAGIAVDERGQTGIPALDLASGPERMQMLTIARTIMNEREADAKASQNMAHDQWLNTFYNELQDGKLGQADLDQAYQAGQLTDFDERRKAQGIIDAKIKKNDDLELWHSMITSGQKFNPFDDKAQKAADAGFDNAVKFAMKNGMNDATPLQIGLRAWQRTGVLPTQVSVMLRGGLVSTDPTQVAASASVASNMLEQNPNAFASTEGGDEIGKAAATYSHYVDDLGMNSTEAAGRIAQMNSPEFQAKVKAGEPERNAFQATIVGDKTHAGVNIEKVLNDQVLGKQGVVGGIYHYFTGSDRGTFSTPQKAEAQQTYLELALDHYDKYHDPAAAQSYASRQMGRFYGVENGRLMKFPATKAYPEIQGSTEYVLDQAKKFVDEAAGQPIPKEDIFLQPTPTGSTAAAFRAGRAPPYQINYVTRTDGQAVYHHIPGKVFVADVDEARQSAAIKAREYEKRIRRTIVMPGIGPVGD